MAVDASLSFGQALRRLRREAELTQEALAERAGISVRTVSDLERGLYQRPHGDTVQLLADAFGLSPEERRLLEAVGGRGSAGPRAEPALPAVPPKRSTAPHHLPDEATPFIGREGEIAALIALLARPEVRLVTLTGAGGTGKTRLALQVGKALLGAFPHGVHFVSLAPVADPALVPSALADVLGLQETGGVDLLTTLRGFLREKQLLLILDNYEHLLDAAPLVASLLETCRQVRVLVTSRIPLHLSREHEYLVPPLAVPDLRHLPDPKTLSQYEAVALFVDRARAVKADFQVTSETALAVAEICSRLDGLPLAIELAAARSKVFPPPSLLQRLSRRLTLLTGGARDLPERQQTLRNTLAWSYSLLSAEEQLLFAHLSIFAGGCTLEAAEAICTPDGTGAVVEGLASLVDKSLLRQEGEEESRFVMLETIREYAQERLEERGEGDVLRERYARWHLAWAEGAARELSGPHRAEWLERLEHEHDNLRAVLQWAQDSGQLELGLRLAVALSPFWRIRAYLVEGHGWLTTLLANVGGDISQELRARALFQAGELVYTQGRDREGAELFEQSLDQFRERDDLGGVAEALGRLADALIPYGNEEGDEERITTLLTNYVTLGRERRDQRLLATALACLAWRAEMHNDASSQAIELGEESLARYRELEDVQGMFTALRLVAAAAYRAGDLPRARARIDKMLALLPQLPLEGDLGVRKTSSLILAARDRGDYGRVMRLVEALMARATELGDTRSAAYARVHLGTLAREQGEYERARTLAQGGLAVFREREDLDGVTLSMLVLSGVARDLGDAQGVIELCEHVLALLQGSGIRTFSVLAVHDLGVAARYQRDYERAEALLRESLTIRRGRRWLILSVDSLCDLGLVALEQDQYERARQLFTEGLQIARTWMDGTGLEGLASVAAGQGAAERAARLFGAAESIRSTMGVPRWPANEALYQRHVALATEALGEDRFARIREEGRAMTAEEAVAYAINQPA